MTRDALEDPPGLAEDGEYHQFDYDWLAGVERNGYSPFRLISSRILIPTLIDDQHQTLFLVDTGASNTIISLQLADESEHKVI